VYLGARDPQRGRAAVDELDGDARLLVLDVTDSASIAGAAAQIEALDALVNNAGINLGGEDAPTTDVDVLRRTFETNVFGVAAVTNAFLPALRDSSHPRIVNISSGTGVAGLEHRPEPTVRLRHRRAWGRLPLVQNGRERAHRLLRPGAGRRQIQGQRARSRPARYEPDQRHSRRGRPRRSRSRSRPARPATRHRPIRRVRLLGQQHRRPLVRTPQPPRTTSRTDRSE